MCNICKVEGCTNKVVAKGLCSKHYTQLRRYGKIFKYSYKDKTNHIEILEDHAEIYLIDRNNEVCGKALIDLDDVDKVRILNGIKVIYKEILTIVYQIIKFGEDYIDLL